MESDALPWVADGSYPEPSTPTTMIVKNVVNILTIIYIQERCDAPHYFNFNNVTFILTVYFTCVAGIHWSTFTIILISICLIAFAVVHAWI